MFVLIKNTPYLSPSCFAGGVCGLSESTSDKFKTLILAFNNFMQISTSFFLFFLMIFVIKISNFKQEKHNLIKFLVIFHQQNKSLLFLWVGLGTIPIFILGRIRVGGAINHFGTPLYFIALSALIGMAEIFKENMLLEQTNIKPYLDTKLIKIFSITFLCLLTINQILPMLTPLYNFQDNITMINKQYQYVVNNKGTVYFTWNPLYHLIAEHQFYHFDYGLADRKLGSYPLTNKHFRDYLPENLQEVVYCYKNTHIALQYLPEFSKKINKNEVPECDIYVKEEITNDN
jgi:hypothetical protein